jgi:hypothetical protein
MESVAQFVAQNAKRENHLAAISLHAIDFTREFGGRTWARTKDPLIKSQLLYQLSYASTPAFGLCLDRREFGGRTRART